MKIKDSHYSRWLGHDESVPARCRTWIENLSGYRYAVHSRAEGRRLVNEWNKDAHSDRDVYTLHCV